MIKSNVPSFKAGSAQGIRSQSGTAMLFIIVLAVISGIVMAAFFMTSRMSLKKSGQRREKVTALNIAEAGKESILAGLRSREIKPDPGQTQTVYSNEPFGSGSYTVSYTTNTRNDTIFITSTGVYQKDTAKIEVVALLTPFHWRNWVKGAVTSRNDVSVLGNIVIDGRDHDTNEVVLGTGGTFGVSAGGAVSIDNAAATIGGGTTAPQNSTIEGETVDADIDTNGYPTTPEEVLGLPPHSLDDFISGCPTPPLSGITYVTSSCADVSGSGVLIVHNSDGDANVGNYHGDFKGLIIADEDKHFNDTSHILGAVILLGQKAGGNVFGNGGAKIRYSSLMVEEVIKDAYDLAGKRWAVPVVFWRQVK